MSWRDTANEARAALRAAVASRIRWDATGDDQDDAERVVAAAEALVVAANRLYASLVNDVWTARCAGRELAHPEQVTAAWAREEQA